MEKTLGKLNKFWKETSLIKKRLVIIISILTSIGFFGKLAWTGFVTVNQIENKLILIDTIEAKLTRHIKIENNRINRLHDILLWNDSISSVITNRSANCWSTILAPYLGSQNNHGVQILFDKNRLEYFYNNADGVIYSVYEDKVSGALYYYNNNNERIICR